MSDIFISYASADRSRVKPLVEALQAHGWSVWWDRAILPGKTWDQVIEAALTDARCVIVLWSRDSVGSDWVKTEAEEAKRHGILVPAMLDDVSIPMGFRRVQAANLVNWPGTSPNPGLEQLFRAVSEVLSGPDAPARNAPSPAVAASWEPGVLDAATKELAAYVGPMAKIIVNRAARQAHSPKQLYEAVAAEIPSPADRAKFLAKRAGQS